MHGEVIYENDTKSKVTSVVQLLLAPPPDITERLFQASHPVMQDNMGQADSDLFQLRSGGWSDISKGAPHHEKRKKLPLLDVCSALWSGLSIIISTCDGLTRSLS